MFPPVLQAHSWQPGIKNPYRGVVVWPVPENIEITVTLFKVGYSCLSSSRDRWTRQKPTKLTLPHNFAIFHPKLMS